MTTEPTPTPLTDAVEKRVFPAYLNARDHIDELPAALIAWSAHEKHARELERKLSKSQDGEAILWSQLAERDEWLACANTKLAKCREELKNCIEIIDELHCGSVPASARETLEQIK